MVSSKDQLLIFKHFQGRGIFYSLRVLNSEHWNLKFSYLSKTYRGVGFKHPSFQNYVTHSLSDYPDSLWPIFWKIYNMNDERGQINCSIVQYTSTHMIVIWRNYVISAMTGNFICVLQIRMSLVQTQNTIIIREYYVFIFLPHVMCPVTYWFYIPILIIDV